MELPEVLSDSTAPEEVEVSDEAARFVSEDADGKILAICPPAKKQNEKKNNRIKGL